MVMDRWKTAVVAAIAAAGLVAGGAVAASVGDSNNPEAPASESRAGAASPAETGFVPITPCRVVNTATSGAGRFAPGQTRAYETQGNTSGQGGAASCPIPAGATALEINITAPSALGEGYVRVAPAGVAIPNATFMNFTDTFNASNAGAVRITPGTGNNLQVRVFNASTHIVIDVLGYYVDPPIAVVAANGTLVRGMAGATAIRQSLGNYRVEFGRDVTGCAFTATLGSVGGGFPPTAGEVFVARSDGNADGVYVETRNAAGAEADLPFHLTVTC